MADPNRVETNITLPGAEGLSLHLDGEDVWMEFTVEGECGRVGLEYLFDNMSPVACAARAWCKKMREYYGVPRVDPLNVSPSTNPGKGDDLAV